MLGFWSMVILQVTEDAYLDGEQIDSVQWGK